MGASRQERGRRGSSDPRRHSIGRLRLREHLAAQDGQARLSWADFRIGHKGMAIEALVAESQSRSAAGRSAARTARYQRNHAQRQAASAAVRLAAGQPAAGRVRRSAPVDYEPVAGRVVAEFSWAMADWHVAGNLHLDPFTIPAGSQRLVSWQCRNEASHIWTARIITRTARRSGCPYCPNRRVSATNSLAAVFPVMAAEWHPKGNGALTPGHVTYGSNKLAWWRCPRRHVYQARIGSRTGLGTGCPPVRW